MSIIGKLRASILTIKYQGKTVHVYRQRFKKKIYIHVHYTDENIKVVYIHAYEMRYLMPLTSKLINYVDKLRHVMILHAQQFF